MSLFSSSVTDYSGYYCLPNGIIEQFARVIIPANASSLVVSPPFKFPNAMLNAIATHNGNVSFFATTVPNADGTVTVNIKPSTTSANSSFFLKMTGK